LPSDLKTLLTLSGSHSWKTEDGGIVLEVKGNTVLVTESIDPAITDAFRRFVFADAATPQ
jgi:hypothetical protein